MLENISPIDGRYREATEEVRNVFSEFYLIKNRVFVEIEWLKKLFSITEMNIEHKQEDIEILDSIVKKFDMYEAEKVKDIELVTKHDVKAVEYYLDEKFKELGIEKYNQFVHFACTSEDINNLAYGIMVKSLVDDVYLPNCERLVELLRDKAEENKEVPMLSHTHGQNATPTTVGKEIAIFVYRLNKILDRIKNVKISGKCNGAVGNFNAHVIAYPEVDWLTVSREFIESFGLDCNLFTTQIESHDNICMLFSDMKLFNNIVLDFDCDMWMYISRNYFLQENVRGEVGSSVMPHKINPINFENSMANMKMANSMINGFVDNLQISRMQRDLSDSSVLRNIGVGFAYSIIAIKQTIIGINKLKVNREFLINELHETPEVLAEAIQTILRKNGVDNAYEILKGLTRGRHISMAEIKEFVRELEISDVDKERLLRLEPEKYLGLADKLVDLL